MRIFFNRYVKYFIVIIFGVMVVISSSTSPANADEEREALMDLQRGATEFFGEIAPSIVQILDAHFYEGALTPGREASASGSGYVIDREGHIITNHHVAGTRPISEVKFWEDIDESRMNQAARFRADLIGADPALDLAVIKVDAPPEKFHPVRLGDSSLIRPGEMCLTFGSPGGSPGLVDRSLFTYWDNELELYNVNLGIISEVMNFKEAFLWYHQISSLDRAGIRDYGTAVEYLFHIDAAINHGNSGGPCLNMYGEAIGTNTWGTGYGNLGFSVPVNLLKRSAVDIIEYGHPRRTWFGVSLHPTGFLEEEGYSSRYMNNFEFTSDPGFDYTPDELMIYTVNPYSPAYEAGLREGDIILRINGEEYGNIFDVYSYVLNSEIGDEIIVEYERDNNQMPPAFITLAEKHQRYFNSEFIIFAGPGYAVDYTFYTTAVTY